MNSDKFVSRAANNAFIALWKAAPREAVPVLGAFRLEFHLEAKALFIRYLQEP